MKSDPHIAPDAQFAGAPAASLDVERSNNTLRAYREMRARVLDGRMATNEQYLEQELAEMLGMSRTPVREALIRLADERLVEVRPRHGARVLGVSAEEMADIYEVCADLEATACRRLVQRGIKDADVRKLEDCLAGMESATSTSDIAGWLKSDAEFHTIIVEAAGNSRLYDIYQGLLAQVHRARLQTLVGRSIPVQSNEDHRDILATIKSGQAEAAAKAMHAHRMRSRTVITELLRKGQRIA